MQNHFGNMEKTKHIIEPAHVQLQPVFVKLHSLHTSGVSIVTKVTFTD